MVERCTPDTGTGCAARVVFTAAQAWVTAAAWALAKHAAHAAHAQPTRCPAHLPLLPGDGISRRAWSPQQDRMY